jgi:hypothetical protein
MTWVWANSPYSGQRLLLHLALADFANDEGFCFPSHGTLAKKARCSQGWVAQTISLMQREGFIEVVEKAGNGRGKVGRYRLLKGHTECDLSQSIDHTLTANRSHSDTSHSSLLNRQETSNTQEAFDELWKHYPRKTAKGAARRAFDRLMQQKDAPALAVLIAAVDRYKSTVSEVRYCAHLSTWLNGERWLDEHETVETQQIVVQKSGEIRSAESLAAAFVHTNRSEDDLLVSLAASSPDAQAAAVAVFREMKAGSR